MIRPQIHLSFFYRSVIVVVGLLMLQLNVPLIKDSSVWVVAELPDFRPVPMIDWQAVKLVMASSRKAYSQIRSSLAPPPEDSKSFKIVKVETRIPEKTTAKSRLWPVRGPISSGFGMRRHPVTLKRSFHNGIDIKARRGTKIIAPEEGVVISAGYAGLLGRLVKIRTNSGKTLYFGHMQKISCIKGQKVRAGSAIGTIGSTGRATGPHLHFTVVSKGKYLNPLQYLSSN